MTTQRTCSFEGCDQPHWCKGYCTKHYQRFRKYGLEGLADKPKTCSVDGCDRPHSSQRGMCNMHYIRWRRYGDAGANHSKFGQGYITADGYRIITVSPYKTMLEHRYVMEQMLGRPLREFENVHHKNGQRADNSPSNLELWIKPQPPGQRPEDLVGWVIENYPDLVEKRWRDARREEGT